jgi:hypothetical protein
MVECIAANFTVQLPTIITECKLSAFLAKILLTEVTNLDKRIFTSAFITVCIKIVAQTANCHRTAVITSNTMAAWAL